MMRTSTLLSAGAQCLVVVTLTTAVFCCLRPHLEAAPGDSARDGFLPMVNRPVYAAVVQSDGKMIIGGQFTMVNGFPRARLARLHPDGSLDFTFDPGASDPLAPDAAAVHALALQPDGKILVGGHFALLGELPRASLGRLNANGTPDPLFDPSPSEVVEAIQVQPDGKVLVGGNFQTLAGEPRPNLGRLNPDGSLDRGFAPALDGAVKSLLLDSAGRIVVGGN